MSLSSQFTTLNIIIFFIQLDQIISNLTYACPFKSTLNPFDKNHTHGFPMEIA